MSDKWYSASSGQRLSGFEAENENRTDTFHRVIKHCGSLGRSPMAQKRKSLTLPGTLFDAARKLFERLPMTAHSDERGYAKRLTDVFAPSAALFSRLDCAFNLLLPATLPAAGHRTF